VQYSGLGQFEIIVPIVKTIADVTKIGLDIYTTIEEEERREDRAKLEEKRIKQQIAEAQAEFELQQREAQQDLRFKQAQQNQAISIALQEGEQINAIAMAGSSPQLVPGVPNWALLLGSAGLVLTVVLLVRR
jgi:Flp pilus assembly protein TadB